MKKPMKAVRLLRNSYHAFQMIAPARVRRPGSAGPGRRSARPASLGASSCVIADQLSGLSMLFSENRYPLFRVMPLTQFDARIEESVGQVDQEVHDHHDYTQHQHTGLDQRIVALDDGF